MESTTCRRWNFVRDGDIPDGWIMMSIKDVKEEMNNAKSRCKEELGHIYVIVLQDGVVNGSIDHLLYY